MEITIFAGKGGVGKSTSATAYALAKAETGETLIVDYDFGHSITRVLDIPASDRPNVILSSGIPRLSFAVMDKIRFKGIRGLRNSDLSEVNIFEQSMEEIFATDIQRYLAQFVGDSGLVPYCDMVNAFFGVPTEVADVSKFCALTKVYHEAKERGFKNVVIDVEPTGGLERLITSARNTVAGLRNLQDKGRAWLFMVGAVWPDIKTYLEGDYIRQADVYTQRFAETVRAIQKDAKYAVVTIPERSPVDQMQDVIRLVESYGGRVNACVVNNIRDEEYQAIQVRRVREIAGSLPVVEVKHDLRLCDSNPGERKTALLEVGKKLRSSF